jgi:hypothetical protein
MDDFEEDYKIEKKLKGLKNSLKSLLFSPFIIYLFI